MSKKKSKGGKSGAAQAKSMVMVPLYRSRVEPTPRKDKAPSKRQLIAQSDGWASDKSKSTGQ